MKKISKTNNIINKENKMIRLENKKLNKSLSKITTYKEKYKEVKGLNSKKNEEVEKLKQKNKDYETMINNLTDTYEKDRDDWMKERLTLLQVILVIEILHRN